ncbi:hypothetical protein ACWDDN_01330 [Streptomyces griseoruber]
MIAPLWVRPGSGSVGVPSTVVVTVPPSRAATEESASRVRTPSTVEPSKVGARFCPLRRASPR